MNTLVSMDSDINMYVPILLKSSSRYLHKGITKSVQKAGELVLIWSWEICEVNVKEDKTISTHCFLLKKHSRCFVGKKILCRIELQQNFYVKQSYWK